MNFNRESCKQKNKSMQKSNRYKEKAIITVLQRRFFMFRPIGQIICYYPDQWFIGPLSGSSYEPGVLPSVYPSVVTRVRCA